MPEDPRNHNCQTNQDGGPNHRVPSGDIPAMLSEGPEGYGDVGDIAYHQGREERPDDFFLEGGLRVEVFAGNGEDEGVD